MAARRAKRRVGALLLAPGAGLELAAARRSWPSRRRSRRCRSSAWTSPTGIAGRKAPDRPPVLLDAVRAAAAALVERAEVAPGPARARRPVDGRADVLDGGRRRAPGRRPRPRSPTRCTRRAGRTTCAPSTCRRSTVPCLFVHGTRDPFGSPDELTAATATIPGPGHPRVDRGRPPRPEGRRPSHRLSSSRPGCPASGRRDRPAQPPTSEPRPPLVRSSGLMSSSGRCAVSG